MSQLEFVRQDDVVGASIKVTLEALSAADIRQQFAASPYARWLINQEWLETLLEDYQSCHNDVVEQRLPVGFVLQRKLARKRDAEVTFQISEDQMVAKATIVAAWGGNPLSANDLVKHAHEAGISFGFNRDHLIRLVTAASRAEPGAMVSDIIAVGRLMSPGENSKFVPQVEGLIARNRRPVALDDQPADLRDFGVLPSVACGEPLVRRIPPTKGVDGVNVKGVVDPAQPGVNLDWEVGEGTVISADDGDLLLAAKDGMPRMLDAGACVDEVYAVKSVDLSTGHIQFKGSVIVNGDVTVSMKVIAGGSIFIKGAVEGSLIEAGGDISIGGAIIGHRLQEIENGSFYSTVVRANGDVSCGFAQYVEITCTGDLKVQKQLNHCQVSARSVLAGPPDKPTGKIVGGNYLLDSALKTGTIGSPSESNLQVDLSRKIRPLMERLLSLRQTSAAIRQEMEEIRRGVDLMRQMEKSESSQLQIQMLAQEFESQKKILLAIQQDIKLLDQQRLELLAEPAVFVKQHVHAGLQVRLADEVYLVKDDHGGSRVFFDGSKLTLEPWNG